MSPLKFFVSFLVFLSTLSCLQCKNLRNETKSTKSGKEKKYVCNFHLCSINISSQGVPFGIILIKRFELSLKSKYKQKCELSLLTIYQLETVSLWILFSTYLNEYLRRSITQCDNLLKTTYQNRSLKTSRKYSKSKELNLKGSNSKHLPKCAKIPRWMRNTGKTGTMLGGRIMGGKSASSPIPW